MGVFSTHRRGSVLGGAVHPHCKGILLENALAAVLTLSVLKSGHAGTHVGGRAVACMAPFFAHGEAKRIGSGFWPGRPETWAAGTDEI
jgi:hypothetical protein